MDRFSRGLPDQQDMPESGECACCGDTLYQVYVVCDGNKFCDDVCALEFEYGTEEIEGD
jgi:hypothetical protein